MTDETIPTGIKDTGTGWVAQPSQISAGTDDFSLMTWKEIKTAVTGGANLTSADSKAAALATADWNSMKHLATQLAWALQLLNEIAAD